MTCFTADTLAQSGFVATDGTVDPECQVLCDALAALSDVEIIAACSGHGIQPLRVWFTVEQHGTLWSVLTACVLAEETMMPWSCVCVMDCGQSPGLWALTSAACGKHAADAADRLATAITLLHAQRGTFPDV